MSVTDFENKRWKTQTQKVEFRHRIALECIREGNVLDIGCGDGLFLRMLKEKGITGTGVDISREAVARNKEAGIEAVEHSLDQPLSFPDRSFDTVTLLDVLEHVYDPAPILAEAKRVARKHVIVSVPNFSSLPARLQVLRGEVPENNRPHKGHLYWFNYSVLTSLIKSVGFSNADFRFNTFRPFSWFGNAVMRMWPNGLALSFVVSLTV